METNPTAPMHSDIIRRSLVERAKRYAADAGSSLSAIGLASVNDSKFLHRVQSGDGFNINTYQRVMDWLDAAEASLREGQAA